MIILTNLEHIGKWPIDGEEARRRKRMILIRPDDTLKVIHGRENHILVSFFVSNNYIHFGTMTIPVGKHSDEEAHKGDEVLSVLQGTLIVQVFDENDSESVLKNVYKVQKHEKFFIPENSKHRYLNLSGEVVKFLFSIAPDL